MKIEIAEMNLVQLAQAEKRAHKKVADLQDKAMDAEDAVHEAKTGLNKATSLKMAEEFVKEWRKANRILERHEERVAEAKATVAEIRRAISDQVNDPAEETQEEEEAAE